MNLKLDFVRYELIFVSPAGTSRGVLSRKPSWFLRLTDLSRGLTGLGEVSIIPGLSRDHPDRVESLLTKLSNGELNVQEPLPLDMDFPAIRFGLEMAFRDLESGGDLSFFRGPFTRGVQPIPINGLIWMGSPVQLIRQVTQLCEKGFRCLKLKIGSLDFEEELAILGYIRERFSPEEMEIRVDANGAFSISEAMEKLNRLSDFHLHSIEQPIPPGNWKEMSFLARNSPVPIALDEELFLGCGINEEEMLIAEIKPAYLVLKPSMLGGFRAAETWIELARKHQIGWWVTSALESNLGLQAISSWTSTFNPDGFQGLGTGSLYTNNFPSPLFVEGGFLHHTGRVEDWDLRVLHSLFKEMGR